VAHHNRFQPKWPLVNERAGELYGDSNSSAYTEVIALDADHVLMVYDRPKYVASGGRANTQGPTGDDSIWVVRGTIKR
jgi:hypothetical protein